MDRRWIKATDEPGGGENLFLQTACEDDRPSLRLHLQKGLSEDILDTMNVKNVAVILAVACAVLLAGLIYQRSKAVKQQEALDAKISSFSNNWAATRAKLEDVEQVNVSLNRNLDESRETGSQLSNKLDATSERLSNTEASLNQTQAALKEASEEIARRDAEIAELTAQNEALDKEAGDLKTAIDNLEIVIADTRKRLENAEGDKAVLEAELKQLMAEKAELERQFHDITELRQQLAKLKAELTVARRLEWIRRGLYGDMKGGQRMLQLSRQPEEPEPPAASTNYDLNVEVKSDGSLKVIPPPDRTNSPPSGP